MKYLILAMLLSTSLAACGAGSNVDGLVSLSAEVAVQPTNQHTFNIVVLGKPSQVIGQGATLMDAAKDVVSTLMSNVFVPGTDEYRALVNSGLTVGMKDVTSGKACSAQMKIGSDTKSVQIGCEI